MSSRKNTKKRINSMLSEMAIGIHEDENWAPIQKMLAKMQHEWNAEFTGSKYEDENGKLARKIWTFEIPFNRKPFYGIIIAHAAGTVNDPMCAYDITAYVS